MVNGISGSIQRMFGSTIKHNMGVAAPSHFLTKSVVEFEQSCTMV